MATRSVYNNVNIKDKNLCKKLVIALENAEGKKSQEVVLSKKVTKVKKEEIEELFSK